jgi:hypothetical protein
MHLVHTRPRKTPEDVLNDRFAHDRGYRLRDHTRQRKSLFPFLAARTIAFMPTYLSSQVFVHLAASQHTT